jgi:hypothetical protein
MKSGSQKNQKQTTPVSNLISDDYLKLQQELHKNPLYGLASKKYAKTVHNVMVQYDLESLSDYGAGKKRLYSTLVENGLQPRFYYPYDPAFPEYGEARTADLVACIDVLEHIEPDLLDNVLDDLQKLVTNIGLFTIHTGPAGKVLADGRNAHLIQEDYAWWVGKLDKRFSIIKYNPEPNGFWVVVKPKE